MERRKPNANVYPSMIDSIDFLDKILEEALKNFLLYLKSSPHLNLD